MRWSRSREGRACFLAALAGVALTLGFYRSESSSAASAAPTPRQVRPVTTLAAGASVRSEPLALTPTATSAPTAGADEADDAAPARALGDASEAVSPAPRKAASAKSKAKKASKHSRKAKRQSVARASSRGGRRAKAQRAVATGPLAAWLATQRSKEASSSKRR